MFHPFFICFTLPSLLLAQSLPHTTITPDGADLVAGSWTISVALPSPTTLEVFIETLFNEYNSVTLVGPTTFTSLVRDRSDDSPSATGGTEDSTTSNTLSSGANGGSAVASGAGPTSTGNGAASDVPSGGSKAADPSSSSTLAAPPSVGTQNQPHYGMDPDSAMAIAYNKQYANVTYTPPAYVPPKIPADVCALWDPSCKGNKTLAAEEFFAQGKANSSGTMFDLLLDPCFDGRGTDASGTNCTSSLLDPASASFSSAAKSYMREPQCSKDYESIYPVSSRTFDDCCGTCYIYGPNVDVYYWPEPGADTSCLSIIGSDVVPLDIGAQTDEAGVVYWAASTNLYDIYVPTVTTALITTINGVVVKEAIANPWDASPSITTTRPVSNVKKRNPLSVHPRAFNPLYGRELSADRNSSLDTGVTASARASEVTGSIAVSDGFTFTSPSVYVAFYSLSATDDCGLRGNNIKSTMLAFAPGELSTVQGHLWGGGVQEQKTKVFNFADLPCPPYEVMYDDWYKPAPGEPYRPLIALPEKVRDLDPWWSACTDAFYFTGLDPPRTLEKATAMVTPVSPAANPDPAITPDPAQPVPALPVQTNAGQPAKAADDPSDNKSPNGGVPPKQADPQQGDASKDPADPPAVDPGTNKDANSPATPQHDDKDPQQGTDPKANDSGSNDAGTSGSGPNRSGSNDSGSKNPGASESGSKGSESSDPGHNDSNAHNLGPNDSGSNNPGSSNPGANDSGANDSGSKGSASNDAENNDPKSQASGPTHSGSNDTGSNNPGANDSGSKGSASHDPENNDPKSQASEPTDSGSNASGSSDPKSNDPNPNDPGSGGSKSNDSPTANPLASSAGDPQSGHGQDGTDPKKASSDQQSQQNDASPAPNSDHQAASANSNTEPQSGPENQNSAPQSPAKDNPSQPGNPNVGTSTYPPGSSQNQPSSSEASPVLNIPGALPLTQVPNNHNAYLVAGSTLLPGSPGAVVSRTSYSLASSGALVVGTSTIPLATAGAVAGQIASPGALWAGNVAFTPLLGGSVIVGSSTLSLSGPAVTSSGSVLSLASGALVVGSSTYAFATPASNPTASSTTQEIPITTALVVAGQSFTANPSAFVVNGTTISAGGPGVTLSGTPVSLDQSGNLAVGTSTVALESTSTGPAATSLVAFEGSSARSKTSYWTLMAGLVASLSRWLL